MEKIRDLEMFIFRVDSSNQMGNGHVMRCLTLADSLTKRNARCFFICRLHLGNLISLIESKGHIAISLPAPKSDWQKPEKNNEKMIEHAAWLGASMAEDAAQTLASLQSLNLTEKPAWLVVDHYAIDKKWENILKPSSKNLMVIDDLADRDHNCDLLLDQTLRRDKADYKSLVPINSTVITGSYYALLRQAFPDLREYSLNRRNSSKLEHLLITLGGVDIDNVTTKVLEKLNDCALPSNMTITVIMGANAPWLNEVKQVANSMIWTTDIRIGVENMAQLMANSDLCIGAAGSTAWERCCLGLPCIMFCLADNQYKVITELERKNAVLISNVSELENKQSNSFCSKIKTAANTLNSLSNNSSQIADGLGCSRVLKLLINNNA